MEEKQSSHIHGNLDELSKQTTCHSLFISFLESRELLSDSDVSKLNSIDNQLNKSQAFYRIITQRSNYYDILCEALKETGQSGALKILERIKPIRFDVRQPVHLFTGREEELTKLHEHLTQGQNIATLITHTASVTGLGGIGKTELCRKYIQKYSTHYDENVIWIGAEKPELMENSFRTLAKDFLNISLKDVDGGDKEIQTVVDEVYNFFREKKCLFIFDNAVSSNDERLGCFLPVRVSIRPNLLITSRDRDWELPMHVLELEELKETEAVEFVKKGLTVLDNSQDEIIIALVTKLQRFPLAIQQAISFINERRAKGQYEIEQYLESFHAESKLLLNHHISSFLSNKYAKTTCTTWKITTDFISTDKESGNEAICILNMISYFEPDKIPSQLLQKHEGWNEDQMHSALQLLVKFSMISCQPKEGMLNIHRLVQEVTRIQLKMNKKEEQVLKNALQLVSSRIILDLDQVSVYHALSAYKFSCASCPEVSTQFKHLPWRTSEVLNVNKRYDEAQAVASELSDLLSKLVLPDDAELIRLEYRLAVATSFNIGGYLDPIKKREEVVVALEKLLQKIRKRNDDSFSEFESLAVQRLLLSYLHDLGRHKEALELSCKTFEQQKNLYGLKHWQTIDALINFANSIFMLSLSAIHSEMSNEEVKQVRLSAKTDCLTHELGNRHSTLLSVLMEAHKHNLEIVSKEYNWTNTIVNAAELLVNIHDMDSATSILNDVIQLTAENSDKSFFRIQIKCFDLLGYIKGEEGKQEDSLVMYESMHSKLVTLKGENDHETLSAKVNISQKLKEMKRFEAALESYTQALQIMEKEHPQHGQLFTTQIAMISINFLMKRFTVSLELLERLKTKKESQSDYGQRLLEKLKTKIEQVSRMHN